MKPEWHRFVNRYTYQFSLITNGVLEHKWGGGGGGKGPKLLRIPAD